MDKNGFVAVVFIFVFVSTTCNASLVFHIRKLIAIEQHNNASATSEVSPTGSPVNGSNVNQMSTGKSQPDKLKEPQMGNQTNTNSNMTLPIDSKGSNKHDNVTKTVDAPSPPAGEKNNSTVDRGNTKTNSTTPNLGNDDNCKGSMIRCSQEMLACIVVSKDGGSGDVFLVVKNEGESTLKVNVKVPNSLKNDLPAFDVPKNESRRKNVSPTLGKGTELIADSGNARCVLPLVQPVSVDNLIQQLSFYSKQVTPIYAVYASFVVALLFGGTWACCRLRKRNQQNGIPYQELEMGIPESAAAVNVDAEEGWDDDWGEDDWNDDSTIKSPSGHQIRTVSADGLVSRSSKKDGWENDWDD